METLRIVAAVDGSEDSRAVLRRAVEEARAHDAVVEVVHAWSYLDQAHLGTFDVDYGEDKACRWLEDFVDETLAERPGRLRLTLVNDRPARALIDASRQAWTVVIGSRGVGGFRGLLLGSVSQQVVAHAHSAVLVIPRAEEGG